MSRTNIKEVVEMVWTLSMIKENQNKHLKVEWKVVIDEESKK